VLCCFQHTLLHQDLDLWPFDPIFVPQCIVDVCLVKIVSNTLQRYHVNNVLGHTHRCTHRRTGQNHYASGHTTLGRGIEISLVVRRKLLCCWNAVSSTALLAANRQHDDYNWGQHVILTCCPVENVPLVWRLVDKLIVHCQLRLREAVQMTRAKSTGQKHNSIHSHITSTGWKLHVQHWALCLRPTTPTFDLFIPKPNQFTTAPRCTTSKSLDMIHQCILEISRKQTLKIPF